MEEEPTKKWKLKQPFESYWLATSNDNFYASSGAIAVAAHPGASRHIGNELNLVAEYELNKGLNFGFGYGRMFADSFFKPRRRAGITAIPTRISNTTFRIHFPVTPNKRN